MSTTASDSSKSPRPPTQARQRTAAGKRAAGSALTDAGPSSGPILRPPVPSDPWLAKQQEALLQERATYTQQAEELKAEADQLAAEMEPGDTQFDEESGEGGTQQLDRERDLALSAQAQSAVEEIEVALARIEDGTYGHCDRCGKTIPKARLEAIPWADLCVQCKSGGLSARR